MDFIVNKTFIISFIIIAAAALAIGFSLQGSSTTEVDNKIKSSLSPEQLRMPNENLTDAQLVDKTRDLKEVKLFLTKYPSAVGTVYRPSVDSNSPAGNSIFVTYRVEMHYFSNPEDVPLVREFLLHVILDPESNTISDVKVNCGSSDPSYHPQMSSDAMTNIENDVCFR